MRSSSTRAWAFARGSSVLLAALVAWAGFGACPALAEEPASRAFLQWGELPALPDELGFAGPFAGLSRDALIVAGGANFPRPVWENDKAWHDRIFVLVKDGEGEGAPIEPWSEGADFGKRTYQWIEAGTLPRPLAYGAAVSYRGRVIGMGGNDGTNAYADVFSLSWNPEKGVVEREALPSLPRPCSHGAATLIGDRIYLAGGQSGMKLETAMNNFWVLDMGNEGSESFAWEVLPSWPGPARGLNLTVAQHNGFEYCVYLVSGRRMNENPKGPLDMDFRKDVHEYRPSRYDAARFDAASGTYTPEEGVPHPWRQLADAPTCMMAGTAAAVGQSHVFVLGGSDGSLFRKSHDLKLDHPGFPRSSYAFHTITGTWIESGEIPANHVTTVAVAWDGMIAVPSGEIKPRVRSPMVWVAKPVSRSKTFGTVNYTVLFGYLLAMVGVGVYFTKKHKNTDDFFRGGQRVVWWAAGCSIFATMLSSLTYTGIPSKVFAQDMVYLVGNMMVLLAAFVAVYVALPFYRRIDATSAYEYLEKRFSRPVRLFGSLCFTLFHLFRMGVVMSLTGLALAAATPLTPAQSVMLMGALSIAYCAMGGIEAVIWTDTIQTFVLLGGAVLAAFVLIAGVDGGFGGFVAMAGEAGKFKIANLHWDVTSAQIALWVIILGGIGQNISSYTADQAVVQRYMTTSSQELAARAIWTNAILAVLASILFFGIGAALFAFYRSNPERLDPTITADQIFPLFIANEMPIGIAGLIVAGVFAAAQSTVSTSMNSTATTIVTDFMRPFKACRSEGAYLRVARLVTFLMGAAGTLLGLAFINPDIMSLFDTFIAVIGLFMGVLGGLFVLGVATRRANGAGALTGALVGAAVMFCLWKFTRVNGYIYAAVGIATCFVSGYIASLVLPSRQLDLSNLTLFTMQREERDA